MALRLEDLFKKDIPIDSEGFQAKIAQKREFAELIPKPDDPPIKKRGEYYKHQKVVQRYMIEKDRCLVIHGLGSGKSCTVIGLAEYFKKHRSYIKGCIVLVKGKTLKQEIINQIICRCSPGEYDVKRTSTGKGNQIRVTNAIKSWYKIKTYGTFVSQLVKKYYYTDESGNLVANTANIIRDYSGYIFWIDEGHNLNTEVDTKSDNVGINRRRKDFNYLVLHDLFHTVKRSKVIITTATPMINTTKEIGELMNLLLPLDNQFPPDFDYDNAELEDFRRYFQGYISYIRSVESAADPKYIGEQIGYVDYDENGELLDDAIDYKTVLNFVEMSEHQTKGYNRAESKLKQIDVNAIGGEIDEDLEEDFESLDDSEKKFAKSRGVFNDERQSVDFVYPNGTYGRDGYKEYIEKSGPSYDVKRKNVAEPLIATDDDIDETLERLEQYSAKYFQLCSRLRLDDNGLPPDGISFVYCNYIDGSGAGVLSVYLKKLGYAQFSETSSIFSTVEVDAGLCGNVTVNPQNRQVLIEKKPRFAFLNKDLITNDTNTRIMFEALNSPENLHGEYINVIISTRIGRDGINIANVQYIDIIDSEWHPSATAQAVARGLRANSHDDLITEKYNLLYNHYISEGLTKKDASQRAKQEARIDVEIRLYAAKKYTESEDEDTTTNDLRMYIYSEKKNRKIRRVLRIAKQLAFDCHINRSRNILPEEYDGTPECDYMSCDYGCADPMPENQELDESNYDLYYVDDYLDIIGKDIIDLFADRFSIKLTELYEVLQQYKPRYIDLATEKLIRNKTQILDRFGFMAYIVEKNGTVFLTHNYPSSTVDIQEHYLLLEYSRNIIASYKNKIIDLPKDIDKNKLERFNKTIFVNYSAIDNLSPVEKMTLIEEAIMRVANGEPRKNDNAILDHYKFYWAKIRVPDTEIEKVRNILNIGKSVKIQKLSKEDIDNLEVDDNQPWIYVNNLNLLKDVSLGTTAYNVVPNYLKSETRIRLYTPGEESFRDASDYENIAYAKYMQKHLDEITSGFIIYGSNINGVFRVHSKKREGDKRLEERGPNCQTMDPARLMRTFWDAGAPTEMFSAYDFSGIEVKGKPLDFDNRDMLIDYLASSKVTGKEVETFSLERLQYYAKIAAMRGNKCGYLEKKLMDDGKFLYM